MLLTGSFLNIFLADFFRIALLVILLLYVIFTLIIVRQVDLMSKTLITPISPIVRGISLIQAGFAIGFLILAFWAL